MSAYSADQLKLAVETDVRARIAWAAFEPNGPKLWGRVKREVSRFMQGLFEQGTFQGRKRKDAYFVKCDANTMTPADIAEGNLIVVVGFADVRPAEFVVLTIGQMVQSAESDGKCKR